MLTDGLQLLGSSKADNFSVDNGPNFPTDDNSIGELFYKTSGNVGLYVFDGSGWVQVGKELTSSAISTVLGFTPAALDSPGGKLLSSQVPAIAITDTFVVANQTSMLALSAEVGDVAVRTDLSKSLILKATPATTLANWQELLTPTSGVTSVNTQTGTVSLTTGNIPESGNLYFTSARARGAISVNVGSSGATYNSTTGVLDLTSLTAGGGGGDSFPSQTGQSGKYLTTNGTEVSWAAVASTAWAGGQVTNNTVNGVDGTTGGNLTVRGGNGSTGAGGSLTLNAGTPSGANTTGSGVFLNASSGLGANGGGAITIQAGAAPGAGAGGSVYIGAANSSTGAGGIITLNAGVSGGSGTTGEIRLQSNGQNRLVIMPEGRIQFGPGLGNTDYGWPFSFSAPMSASTGGNNSRFITINGVVMQKMVTFGETSTGLQKSMSYMVGRGTADTNPATTTYPLVARDTNPDTNHYFYFTGNSATSAGGTNAENQVAFIHHVLTSGGGSWGTRETMRLDPGNANRVNSLAVLIGRSTNMANGALQVTGGCEIVGSNLYFTSTALTASYASPGLGFVNFMGTGANFESTGNQHVRFRSTAAAGRPRLYFQNATTAFGDSDGFIVGMETNGTQAVVHNFETGPLSFGTSSTTRFSITANGGWSMGTGLTAYGTQGQVLMSNVDANPSWTSTPVLTSVTGLPGVEGSTNGGTITIAGGTGNTSNVGGAATFRAGDGSTGGVTTVRGGNGGATGGNLVLAAGTGPTTPGIIQFQSGGSAGAQLDALGNFTVTRGNVYIGNMSQTGVGAPTFSTRSNGTRVVVYPGIAAAAADYAIGIESSTMWQSVPQTVNQFKWYHGTQESMRLQNGAFYTLAHHYPLTTDTYDIGSASARWRTAYFQTAPTVGSDIRIKNDVQDLSLGLDFINSLRPVSYELKAEPGSARHWGLIAQEVKAAMEAAGQESSAWVEGDDDNKTQALRYEQLIAPMLKAIQELSQRVTALENK